MEYEEYEPVNDMSEDDIRKTNHKDLTAVLKRTSVLDDQESRRELSAQFVRMLREDSWIIVYLTEKVSHEKIMDLEAYLPLAVVMGSDSSYYGIAFSSYDNLCEFSLKPPAVLYATAVPIRHLFAEIATYVDPDGIVLNLKDSETPNVRVDEEWIMNLIKEAKS